MNIEIQPLLMIALSNALVAILISMVFYRRLHIKILSEQVNAMKTEMGFIGLPTRTISYKNVHISYRKHLALLNKNRELIRKKDIRRINNQIKKIQIP